MPANREAISWHRARCWGGSETTPGAGPSAAAGPVAADAFDFETFEAPIIQTRRVIPNKDYTGFATNRPPTRGAYDPVAIKLGLQLRGSGSATTPPDYFHLFLAAAMSQTIGGSSVTYDMQETAPDGITAWHWIVTEDGELGLCFTGIGIEEISCADLGAQEAKIHFSGMASGLSTAAKCLVGTGGVTNVATALPLQAGHGFQIAGSAPVFIRVTEGANTEVMKATALTRGAPDTLTVVRNITGSGAFAFTIAAVITPYVPTRTVASTVQVGEHLGSFTIDDGGGATAYKTVKHGIAIKTGVAQWEKEAFSDQRPGIVKQKLSDDSVRWTVDWVHATGTAGVVRAHTYKEMGTDLALSLVVGTIAGNKVQFDAPDAQAVEVNAPTTPGGAMKGTMVAGCYDIAGTGKPLTITFK